MIGCLLCMSSRKLAKVAQPRQDHSTKRLAISVILMHLQLTSSTFTITVRQLAAHASNLAENIHFTIISLQMLLLVTFYLFHPRSCNL